MRPFKWDRKYLHWGITAFLVIACSIIFFMALNYLPAVAKLLGSFIKIISPFIWGLAITYLLLPGMKLSQAKLFLPLCRRIYKKRPEKAEKSSRGFAVLLMVILLLAVIAALIYLILPQVYSSLETIVKNSSQYIDTASAWIEKTLEDYPEIESYAMDALDKMNDSIVNWISSKVLPSLGSVISNVTTGVYYVLRAVYNLLVGIVVSVYVMGNIEKVKAGAKKIMYSIFSLKNAEKLLSALRFTDKTFMGFITGKLLDSAIIGLLCYIFCVIAGMPYALLISVIVGVTNVIPFFGPFIGAIPSALILLLLSPIKCLIFIIFIIILQQLDGNFIGPKILGSSIGINGFWIMFSIILGAGLFGFWGMLLGVPVFVVIYTLITMLVNKGLEKKSLPVDTAEYRELDKIDPATGDFVRAESGKDEEKTNEKGDKTK